MFFIYFLAVHVQVQSKMVSTNKATMVNEIQGIKNGKTLPIRTVRSQATKDKARALPAAVYADKSTFCTKVDLEREAEVEHLVPQHATQLTFLNDCSFSVNGGDAIPPCHRKTNTSPYRGGGDGGGGEQL